MVDLGLEGSRGRVVVAGLQPAHGSSVAGNKAVPGKDIRATVQQFQA